MVSATITCRCSEIILKSDSSGVSKIRSKIMILREDSVYAVCKGCGTEVLVPLTIMPTPDVGPMLILRK